jgi:hypothetical protein
MKFYQIGKIDKSRFWASIEIRRYSFRALKLGKTYQGTVAGILIVCKRFSFMAHIRKLED